MIPGSLVVFDHVRSEIEIAVLPEAFNRPMAVPEGIALIGLGVSLWRHARTSSVEAGAAVPVVPAVPGTTTARDAAVR